MPDRRRHRGPHPEDARLFAPAVWSVLRRAAAELCWLLDRGYAEKSALKLVGDRHNLVARQRIAVGRCCCTAAQAQRRRDHQIAPDRLAGRPLRLDGYNVLTTVESALAGGVVLAGRDAVYRDMASMHGSYRKVAETLPALRAIGRLTTALRTGPCLWYLDRPVSNSGRLAQLIRALAADEGWPWQVDLVDDPDSLLAEGDQIVATADSAVLDRCDAWFNLARETVASQVPQPRIVDLGEPGGP